MVFEAGGVDVLGLTTTGAILPTGVLLLNETSNNDVVKGITIKTTSGDVAGHLVALKRDGVTHGATSLAETDTMFYISLITESPAITGIGASSTSENGLVIGGICGASGVNTTKTTAAAAPVQFGANKVSGTTQASVGPNGNLFVFRDFGMTRVLFDREGDIFADGGTASTTMVTKFDAFEDAHLIRALDFARGGRGLVRTEFDKFLTYGEDKLVELGILGAT